MAAGRERDLIGQGLCLALGGAAVLLPFLDWARADGLWLAAAMLLPPLVALALFRPGLISRILPGGLGALTAWLLLTLLLFLALLLDAWVDRRAVAELSWLIGPEGSPPADSHAFLVAVPGDWRALLADLAQRAAAPGVLSWSLAAMAAALVAQGRRNPRLLRRAVALAAGLQGLLLLLLPGSDGDLGTPGLLLFLLAAVVALDELLGGFTEAVSTEVAEERLRRVLLLPLGLGGAMILALALSLAGARLVAGQSGLALIGVSAAILIAVRIETGTLRLLPALLAIGVVIVTWALV